MARTKHWHLTTDGDKATDRGAPIKTRENAEGMACILRRYGKPIYVQACTEEHTR